MTIAKTKPHRALDKDLDRALEATFPASDPVAIGGATGLVEPEPDLTDEDELWRLERQLWVGEAEVYRKRISRNCLMVLPTSPYLFPADAAVTAVENTPRWLDVDFADKHLARVTRELIVIAYRVAASREETAPFEAYCSTVYAASNEGWQVVQHQQTPRSVAVADVSTEPVSG